MMRRRRRSGVDGAKEKQRLRNAYDQATFRVSMLRYGLIGVLKREDAGVGVIPELTDTMSNYCEALRTEETAREEFYGSRGRRVVVRRVHVRKATAKKKKSTKEGTE